ncbi:MAG: acyl carrier protein [Nitrososphaerota archaeon]|nr:acyl carrier protein [Nitrososphaerota archaeon]
MSNSEKYDQIFMESFLVEKSALNDSFVYQSVKTWDSVGHMSMIAALESAFDITMETDDIIDFSSYAKGKELLSKYGVNF